MRSVWRPMLRWRRTMNLRHFAVIICAMVGFPTVVPPGARAEPGPKAPEVRALGTRRELFVDGFLIDKLQGAALTLERPCPAGIVLRFDQPWEGAFCGYATVL